MAQLKDTDIVLDGHEVMRVVRKLEDIIEGEPLCVVMQAIGVLLSEQTKHTQALNPAIQMGKDFKQS